MYSPGSPPLPLTGPLQLVYLQPTAHGAVNIIPFQVGSGMLIDCKFYLQRRKIFELLFQATGHPTFSPGSPLGFPAHPHHPVVVQTPQPFITSSPGGSMELNRLKFSTNFCRIPWPLRPEHDDVPRLHDGGWPVPAPGPGRRGPVTRSLQTPAHQALPALGR